MNTPSDKPQPTGTGGGHGTGSTGGTGGSSHSGGGGGQPGGGTQPGGGHSGGGQPGDVGSQGGGHQTGGGQTGGGQTGGPGHIGDGTQDHTGGDGGPSRHLPKGVEFTFVTVMDDSDIGEGEVELKFTVNNLPPQFSGRMDISDDDKAPKPLHAKFKIPDDAKSVTITVEGREDDSPGYTGAFASGASHYDKLGVASVTIKDGEQWKLGENEISSGSGKFRVKYRLL